jgi:hypothetical protein
MFGPLATLVALLGLYVVPAECSKTGSGSRFESRLPMDRYFPRFVEQDTNRDISDRIPGAR